MPAAVLTSQARVIEQLKTYVQKLLTEKDTSPELKAALIQRAIDSYAIPNPNISYVLGMSEADAQQFLAQAIPINEVFDFHGHAVNHFYAAKLERQLRTQKTLLKITYQSQMPQDWVISDMANRLAYNGLTDLNDFGVRHEPATQTMVDWATYGDAAMDNPSKIVEYVRDVYYNKATGQEFPDLNGDNAYSDCWAKSYEGDGGTAYRVRIIDTGMPVFYTTHFRTDFFYEYAGFLKAAAMIAAFAGVPALIGESVFGAVGVTVPASVETAVGSIAMNTAFTGGDVKLATTGAIKKLATGGISDIVSEIDPVSFSDLTGAAADAAVNGQSIHGAIAQAKNMDELDLDALTMDMLDTAGFDVSNMFPDGAGNAFNDSGEFVALSANDFVGNLYVGSDGALYTPSNNIFMTRDQIELAIGSPDPQASLTAAIEDKWQSVQGKTETTYAADAYRPASIPAPAATTVVPDLSLANVDAVTKSVGGIINVFTAVKKGTFVPQNTSPYGTIRPQQVGVPVRQADGSVVVNNGNGTQTVTSPTGQTRIVSTSVGYGLGSQSLIAGISNQTLLIGGGILLAALLLRK